MKHHYKAPLNSRVSSCDAEGRTRRKGLASGKPIKERKPLNLPVRVGPPFQPQSLLSDCTVPCQSLEVFSVAVDLSAGPCGLSPGITSEALDLDSKMGLSGYLSVSRVLWSCQRNSGLSVADPRNLSLLFLVNYLIIHKTTYST